MERILIMIIIFSSIISGQNWFPLKVGNTWDYWIRTQREQVYPNISFADYSKIYRTKVQFSQTINDKVYFYVSGLLKQPSSRWLRYDSLDQKVYIYNNNQEYLYMDFSLAGGNSFQHYGPNSSYVTATVIENFINFNGSMRYSKGFTYYMSGVNTYLYFIEDIGLVRLTESTPYAGTDYSNGSAVEYLLKGEGTDTLYYKHNNQAYIVFNPITFLSTEPILRDTFRISHPYNNYGYNFGPFWSYVYIDSVFMLYYYSNGTYNTAVNKLKLPIILQPGSVKSTFNFTVDTTLYQAGYHLYYRIGVKDKGIIPSYFYLPDSGYIKLYWRDSISSVNNDEMLVTNFYLYQNYPNPFNPSTKISWQSPVSGWQTIKVYDILGNEIATLVDEYRDAGRYEVEFNAVETRRGLSLPSGVYFYQLRVIEPSSSSGKGFVETKKMMLLQ